MARKAKKNGWVGGSFKAAVGGYLKKKFKTKKAKAVKSLKKGFRRAIWA